MHLQIESTQRGRKWTKSKIVLVLEDGEPIPNRYELETLLRQAIKEMPSSTSFMTIVRLTREEKKKDPPA